MQQTEQNELKQDFQSSIEDKWCAKSNSSSEWCLCNQPTTATAKTSIQTRLQKMLDAIVRAIKNSVKMHKKITVPSCSVALRSFFDFPDTTSDSTFFPATFRCTTARRNSCIGSNVYQTTVLNRQCTTKLSCLPISTVYYVHRRFHIQVSLHATGRCVHCNVHN